MWHKTYSVLVPAGTSPRAVMAAWRERFPGLCPPEISGGQVLYADAESFTATTGLRDRIAGWITLSCDRTGSLTTARVHVLARAADPLSELVLALGGSARQDEFWLAALTELAHRLGVTDPAVIIRGICLDSRRQWRNTLGARRHPLLRATRKLAALPLALLR
jgi:hypothetical protein